MKALNEEQTQKRHHLGGRLRHTLVPRHTSHLQAALAGIRQANDLLPIVHLDAQWHQGGVDHLNPA